MPTDALLPLLVHIVPLAIVAAVSPVMFLNAARVTKEDGRVGGRDFAIGAVLVLLAVGILGMGLLGSALTAVVEREVASRAVDVVLAILLVVWGASMLRGARAPATETPATASPPSRSGARRQLATGALGMATNFTTLPIFLSLSQKIGASTQPFWVQAVLLVLMVAISSVPAWAPAVAAAVHPGGRGLSPHLEQRLRSFSRLISIVVCFAGAGLILWHVFA